MSSTEAIKDLYAQYPSLASSEHQVTSEDTDVYNCVAWIRDCRTRWIEPGYYWPHEVDSPPDGEPDLQYYLDLFAFWGYERCEGPELDDGYLKIAIYAKDGDFHHVARQLRDGHWSSKAGTLQDLRHAELDALHPCGMMQDSRATHFMRVIDDGRDMQVVEQGLILNPDPPDKDAQVILP